MGPFWRLYSTFLVCWDFFPVYYLDTQTILCSLWLWECLLYVLCLRFYLVYMQIHTLPKTEEEILSPSPGLPLYAALLSWTQPRACKLSLHSSLSLPGSKISRLFGFLLPPMSWKLPSDSCVGLTFPFSNQVLSHSCAV